jgi:hypothetical protein
MITVQGRIAPKPLADGSTRTLGFGLELFVCWVIRDRRLSVKQHTYPVSGLSDPVDHWTEMDTRQEAPVVVPERCSKCGCEILTRRQSIERLLRFLWRRTLFNVKCPCS